MICTELDIPGVFLIEPKKHGDDRGFFSETFRLDLFRQMVGDVAFVQDNHSMSGQAGTIRGLHFQRPPFAQGKLVRVTRGAVIDVVVDIRKGSPTYGQSLKVELSAANWRQLWVPVGMLHGFCTLEDQTEFLYKVTAYYDAASDAGVRFDDPDLGIDWPVAADRAVVSEKDRKAPKLRDFAPIFQF